ncbi:uncharacterized protein LOC117110307 [Anneissia japonica]|uniref:uncharacterized protein LOC117110307 n=1 Tax=Anneissia japonica TaxID=1529436 RepID=UPI00142589CB|nr:uncharacterized protein LOC117110307 [Anneissia japonica]
MVGYASRLSPFPVLILAGIGLLLCIYPLTISGTLEQKDRVARSTSPVEVCQPLSSSDNLRLTIYITNSTIEIDELGGVPGKWNLGERCQDLVSQTTGGVSCKQRTRTIVADLIDLTNGRTQTKEVVVSSCAAYTIL